MSRHYHTEECDHAGDALQDIDATLDRIADLLERIADKIAPTPEQIEDAQFAASKAEIERHERQAAFTAQWLGVKR